MTKEEQKVCELRNTVNRLIKDLYGKVNEIEKLTEELNELKKDV